MHAIVIHGFNLLPVYPALVRRYIYTMNTVLIRNWNIKIGICMVVRGAAHIAQPSPGRRKTFNDVAVIKRRKQDE